MPMPTARSESHAATSRRSSAGPDAIKLLKDDHAEVKKLFGEYDKLAEREADAEEREALALQICDMLTAHTTIEEEIFYPACREALQDDDDLVDEAAVEHASAKELIAQIEGANPDDELYDAKVKVLGEYVNHHVKEEQNELFPKVKNKIDAKALGQQMQERKDELMAKTH
jgi:hemerythrin-like domain-containing protein